MAGGISVRMRRCARVGCVSVCRGRVTEYIPWGTLDTVSRLARGNDKDVVGDGESRGARDRRVGGWDGRGRRERVPWTMPLRPSTVATPQKINLRTIWGVTIASRGCEAQTCVGRGLPQGRRWVGSEARKSDCRGRTVNVDVTSGWAPVSHSKLVRSARERTNNINEGRKKKNPKDKWTKKKRDKLVGRATVARPGGVERGCGVRGGRTTTVQRPHIEKVQIHELFVFSPSARRLVAR